MTEDPRTAATLDAKRRQLLALMMQERGVDPLQAPILPQPRDRDGYVLSFAQERLWLIDQIEPGNIAYNVPTALRVRGTLDPAVAAASFTEVARRHQTLRTTFASAGGRPVQRISPHAPVPVPLIDLSALPAAVREPESRRVVVEESGLPFDLSAGVLRVRLVRLAPEDHILLFTLHHISSDGWSNGVLAREMVQVYQAFAAGRPSPLPELPVQYVDFAHWQRQALRGPVLDRMVEYWRRHLDGVPVLELPTDRPRPPVPSLDGGLLGIEVPAPVFDGLKELGRAEMATQFMLVGALYLTFLSRYSGQTDLSFGTPVANRHRTEVEPLIGFFVNTLVVRADLSGDPTFRELLRRVRKLSTDAFAHQEVPFSKLVEVLNPARSLAHTPLFQVLFGMGNAPASRERLSGLSFDPLDDRTQTSMFELNLSAASAGPGGPAGDGGAGLGYSFEYRTELWDATSIRRMLAHLVNLTAGAVADPDLRLSELPLLTLPEVHQLDVEWNDTAAPSAPLIDEQLTGWTDRDGAALVFEDRSLTWRELDAAANRLARRLRRLSAGPGTRIGFCAGRSLEMAVGFLAVLRTGAAYVPLDPAYPVERLAWMLADA
ncbi:MAG TPA: condensation domain-containing protein, partial [Thermoanaerobaculia bacterium]|nr:condensation domain-containing protein [Thermoanaerobaculia bacterium]